MTVSEIKNEVMFQTNNDTDDLGDYLPYLMDYINEGYDRLVYAYAQVHLASGTDYVKLALDTDVPAIPAWTHRALADWATWLVYRNGNPQRQNRGYPFRSAFEEVEAQIIAQGGAHGRVRNFFNIPR